MERLWREEAKLDIPRPSDALTVAVGDGMCGM